MEQKVLQVEGMSCGHCKMAVEKALQQIGAQGIVSLEKKEVAVSYDPARISLEQIVAAIEDQGYEVASSR